MQNTIFKYICSEPVETIEAKLLNMVIECNVFDIFLSIERTRWIKCEYGSYVTLSSDFRC